MFKKKDQTVTEISNPGEKFSRTIVKETVETSGGMQTTRTVIKSSNNEDIEAALKRFNMGTENFRTGSSTVTKKVVYSSSTSSGKQMMQETMESFENKSTFEPISGKTYITREVIQPSSSVHVTKTQHTDSPTKSDSSKGAKKTGKTLTERIGFKSAKSPTHIKTTQSTPTATTEKVSANKAPPSVKPGKFEDEALKSHNVYRAKHGVPPLKLSKEICGYSKEWADNLAATDSFRHRSERKYGENIFMKWSSDPNHTIAGNEAVDSWYSEIKDHVFGREPTSLKSGHFTQVIWKKSAELGIAWARSRSGKIIVVANYNPAGNLLGTFAENVPAPKK